MLGQEQPRPWDIATRSQTAADTGLLELADLKRKQASEQEVMAAIQRDPSLQALLFGGGGSTIGSLPTTGGPPAPGPITQSPLGGGPSQTIPASPDASRFATVPPTGGGPIPPNVMGQTMPTVTPPQSVLGSLGPAGGMPGGPQGPMQGPMQGPQNPLLEMARKDPRAAMMLQQQMQGQQDRQWKQQEQQLGMGVKVLGYVAQQAQGVRDQASLDTMRTDLQSSGLGKYAAQLPQFYSKEAMEPFIARGSTAKDRAESLYHEAKARNLDMETRMFPELAKRFGLGDDAQTPTGETAPTPGAPGAGTAARTAPPEFESAITEANRLYPQVSTTRIKSIIAAESSYDPKAESSKGAKGPMGLMDDTAREMGVKDSFNVQENVRGGTRYYAQLLTKYGGDERKALTAYNWGMGNFAKAGDDVTKAPPETQAYVQRVLGGGGAGGSGGTPGTAQAPPADPRIAQLDAKIAQRTRDAQLAALMKNESLSTRLEDEAKRLRDERTRLLTEARHQQERAEEIPRAVAKKTAETEEAQRLERQRQSGPPLPEERRKAFGGLRGDILKEPTFKIYQDVRNGYQNVKVGAESDSAQGDLAIFNGLAKILDPTSSVMSGEARNIEEAQGQLQMWFNSPAKFLEGDRISKENRPRFLKMAYDLAKVKLTTAQSELKTVWGPIAKESNIDFDQLVPLPDLTPLGPGPNVSKFDKILEKAN